MGLLHGMQELEEVVSEAFLLVLVASESIS